MENVLLLDEFLIPMTLKKVVGDYNNDGDWEETTTEKEIFGAVFPFKPNDFKNYPVGLLKSQDQKLITKEDIEDLDTIILNDEEYKIISLQNYTYLADVRFYILRRKLNDRYNQETDKQTE